MLSTFLFLSASALAPETLTLGLKPNDKLSYTIEVKSPLMGIDASGKLPLTVTKKDGTKLTLSWPQVDMTNVKGNFRPIEAGSAVITEKGAMIEPDPKGQAVMFLMPWVLPDRPISVGESFKAPGPPGPVKFEFNGKFEKVANEGAVAVLVSEGKMGAQGGDIAVRCEGHFDIKRGIFRNGTVTMTTSAGQVMSSFAFKLSE